LRMIEVGGDQVYQIASGLLARARGWEL